MELLVDLSKTKVVFSEAETENEFFTKKIRRTVKDAVSVLDVGRHFSGLFKRGLWDGKHHHYIDHTDEFPTGLLNRVDEALGELQHSLNFGYKIIDNRPDPLLSESDIPKTIRLNNDIVLRDYQYNSIVQLVKQNGYGVFELATNSGKTLTAVGLMDIARHKLEEGETITFFAPTKLIFNQAKKVIEEHIDEPIGNISSGKMDVQRINVAMIPTVASALKIDVEAKISLTERERITKKIAKEYAPQFLSGKNQKALLKHFLKVNEPKTKIETKIFEKLESILDTSESDAKAKFKLKQYNKRYQDILYKRNKEKFEKKERIIDFLNSVTVGVYDEFHRVKGDGYYNVIQACENALIKLGLTGSIDRTDDLMTTRIQATAHNILYKVSNDEMIERGVSANVKVFMTPITKVVNNGHERNLLNERDYQTAYDAGIVSNEFRNAMTAKMGKLWYEQGEVVLIIVSRIEHGERISNLLDELQVTHGFIHGEHEVEERDRILDQIRSGDLHVLVSSTILDEGVDVSNLSVLINAGGGKSLRQVLQRVGRVLRKKADGREATVIDFKDRTNDFLKRHSDRREEIYIKENFNIKDLE